MSAWKFCKCLSFAAMAVVISLGPVVTSARAADQTKQLSLELNNAKQVETGCRVSFLFHNELGQTIDDIAMEVAILDQMNMSQNFLLISTGRLTDGKRRVLQYDLPEQSCEEIGTILINDVSTCNVGEMTPADCLDSLNPSSRISIKLGL
ncbi:hypothetical protein [Sneathiella sp.]|uniref:hypothetical protein n=1 Tax=Sneathiella sp. TaxID=1964365 RepID=UPI0025F08FCB|nr:hypothetical protein [Sneathiella sp.]|tara:strand:- start:353 stop:802 length:450 start_codon:yes stop_codon:yes gene_type:complete